jgi:hypothetical protein
MLGAKQPPSAAATILGRAATVRSYAALVASFAAAARFARRAAPRHGIADLTARAGAAVEAAAAAVRAYAAAASFGAGTRLTHAALSGAHVTHLAVTALPAGHRHATGIRHGAALDPSAIAQLARRAATLAANLADAAGATHAARYAAAATVGDRAAHNARSLARFGGTRL